jgi:hypothetical protein
MTTKMELCEVFFATIANEDWDGSETLWLSLNPQSVISSGSRLGPKKPITLITAEPQFSLAA